MTQQTFSRRGVLASGAAVGAALTLGAVNEADAIGRGVIPARAGTAQAVIVPREITDFGVPEPTGQLDHAVQTLVDCIADSTGATLPVRTQDQIDADPAGLPDQRIYVGWQGPDADAELQTQVDSLDEDGFVIDADRGRIIILGPTDWGTRFGVYDFCERYLGVQWLMPGPDGMEVKRRSVLQVPPGRVVEEPDFLGRSYSPLFLSFPDGIDAHAEIWTNPDPKVRWATYNRTRQRGFRRGHSMYMIFPPSVYADPMKPETYHPEYYPEIGGNVALPRLDQRNSWQPRFNSDATVEVAIDWVLDWFSQYPDREDVPLCVNDGFGYSDGDYDPDVLNSMGHPSASDAYYGWVNRVVEGVLLRDPSLSSKKFMAIAYYYTADRPSFDLHPQVVPIITRDSHLWTDPEVRPGFAAYLDDWADAAQDITWFDYPFGTPFIAPRLYLTDLAASYRHALGCGVRYQYGDSQPDLIGEGPKFWVYNKLLWDVDADVDELVDQWCEGVAGQQGAAHLRHYFDFFEEFWTSTILDSSYWIFSQHRTYVYFKLCTYLDELTETTMADLSDHLSAAMAAATTAKQRARIALIQERHRYLELTVQTWPRPVPAPATESEALALVADVSATLDDRVAAAEERRTLAATIEADPVLKRGWDHDETHLWTGFNGDECFHLVDHLASAPNGAVRDALEALTTDSTRPVAARFASFVLSIADGNATELLPNSGLEDGGPGATPWRIIGNVVREDGIGRNGGGGARSWTTPGASKPHVEHDLLQDVPATPGLVASRLWFKLEQPENRSGVMSMKFHWRSEANGDLQQAVQITRHLSDGQDGWAWLAIMEDMPAVAGGKPVKRMRAVGSLLAYDGAADVFWDGFEAFGEA